jgi:hypothetical protein
MKSTLTGTLTVEFDTELDIDALNKLSKALQEINISTNVAAPGAKKEISLLPEENKVINITKATPKQSWVIGMNNLDDGSKVFIYEKLNNMENKGLRKTNCKGYRVQCPDGIIYIFPNLRRFCKEQRLDVQSMEKLIDGALKRYKGWTLSTKHNHIIPYTLESVA